MTMETQRCSQDTMETLLYTVVYSNEGLGSDQSQLSYQPRAHSAIAVIGLTSADPKPSFELAFIFHVACFWRVLSFEKIANANISFSRVKDRSVAWDNNQAEEKAVWEPELYTI